MQFATLPGILPHLVRPMETTGGKTAHCTMAMLSRLPELGVIPANILIRENLNSIEWISPP